MDTLILMIGIYPTAVRKGLIVEINNGKAKTATGRWYEIVCDCLSIKDYETVPDSEAPGGNGYIVCEICNKIHYLKDLRP